jgi:D-alanyl-lipoteichoic acid acyltransferase DltB (MBOAT superfamily)
MPQLHLAHFLAVAVMAALGAVCPPRVWRWLLPVASTLYLGHWDQGAATLLLVASLMVWWFGRLPVVGPWLGLAVVGVGFVVARFWQRESALAQVGIPIGFGFAALRFWHYQVERRRGALPTHGWLDLYSWLIYFPTVVVGPVQRFEEWARWERRRRFDPAGLRWGLHRMLIGYLKVTFVASVVFGQALPRLLMPLPPTLAVAIQTLLVVYAMFAGLSDIAIGVGRMLGQRIPENFESPFFQPDLASFWRHWHMTVSAWCRDYVFMPMLARWRRPWLAAAAAIGAFALWHELTVAYVAWGAWHACGLLLWRGYERHGPVAGRALVGPLMLLGWVVVGSWGLQVWPRGGEWYAR